MPMLLVQKQPLCSKRWMIDFTGLILSGGGGRKSVPITVVKRIFQAILLGRNWKSLSRVQTLCDPRDYTVHGILQAKILEWVAFPFSRGSSQLRDQTRVSSIVGRFFTSWATREAQEYWSGSISLLQQILPDPGIKPRSPALQEDSLPTELSEKPQVS